MKFGKKEACLVIGLVGILIAVATWFLYASPTMDKTIVLENENATLKVKAEEYEGVSARLKEYTDTIALYNAEKAEIMSHYPVDIRTTDQIMFWSNMDKLDPERLGFKDLQIEARDAVAVSGVSDTGEATLNIDESGNATFSDADVSEITASYKLFGAPTGMNFACTYDGLKEMIAYVNSQYEKNSIHQIDVFYDDNLGYLTGSLWVELYYIEGLEKEYQPVYIPAVPKGQSDVFHSGSLVLMDENGNLISETLSDSE